MILTKHLNSNSLITFGLLFIIVSIPVFSEALWAHSELLFIFLITLYVDSLFYYIEKESVASLIVLVIITSLAILNRYIGIVLFLTAVITILLYSKENLKNKFRSIFVYSVFSGIPISISLIRNYILSKTFFGERGASRYSFWYNIKITVEKILSWDIPDHFISLKIFFIIFILMTIVFLWLFLKKKIRYKKLLLTTDKRILVILGLFIFVSLSYLILISTFKAHNSIYTRLLSPVFIPVTILLLIILQAFIIGFVL